MDLYLLKLWKQKTRIDSSNNEEEIIELKRKLASHLDPGQSSALGLKVDQVCPFQFLANSLKFVCLQFRVLICTSLHVLEGILPKLHPYVFPLICILIHSLLMHNYCMYSFFGTATLLQWSPHLFSSCKIHFFYCKSAQQDLDKPTFLSNNPKVWD